MSSMLQLKKLAAIGGAISLALCWPLAVGQIGQSVIEDGVKNLNSESVKSEIVSYDRGYLSSTVITRYTITDPDLVAQLKLDGVPPQIDVKSEITHGLISMTADSVVTNWPEIPLTLHTVTQLNGNTDFNFNLDTWHQTTEGDGGAMMLVTPSTLKGHATVLGQVSFDLEIPSVEVDFNSGEKLVFDNITGQGDGKKLNGFWIGDQLLKIKQMSVLNSQQTTEFSLDNAQYQYAAEYSDVTQRVASKHDFEIGEITLDGEKLDNVEFKFAFGDLDAVAFEQLVNKYQSSPMLTAEDLQVMIPYIDTIFAKGFYLSSDKMAMSVGKGQYSGDWKLIVPEGTENISKNPMKLLPALQGHFNSFLSNEFVQQFPSVQQAVDEGMIMEFVQQAEDGYQVKAEIKEGNLVFEGGQKVPLMSLFLPLMM